MSSKLPKTVKKWTEAGRPTCFYTGVTLVQKQNNPWHVTIEHLVPQHTTKEGIDRNLVFAAACVNSMVGHAPLRVKFELKNELCSGKLVFFPKMDHNKRADQTKKFIKGFLSKFCVKGSNNYPWNFYCETNMDLRSKLHKIYWELLTEEEQELVRRSKPQNVYNP